MNDQAFGFIFGFGGEFFPYRTWPSKAEGIKRLLLIQEDHSFTFKTSEQRHARNAKGELYDPNPYLPYGP